MDYNEEAVDAILHQVQQGMTRFIGAKGRKCRAYEENYRGIVGFRLWVEKI